MARTPKFKPHPKDVQYVQRLARDAMRDFRAGNLRSAIWNYLHAASYVGCDGDGVDERAVLDAHIALAKVAADGIVPPGGDL